MDALRPCFQREKKSSPTWRRALSRRWWADSGRSSFLFFWIRGRADDACTVWPSFLILQRNLIARRIISKLIANLIAFSFDVIHNHWEIPKHKTTYNQHSWFVSCPGITEGATGMIKAGRSFLCVMSGCFPLCHHIWVPCEFCFHYAAVGLVNLIRERKC